MQEKTNNENDFNVQKKIFLFILFLTFIRGIIKTYIVWTRGIEGLYYVIDIPLYAKQAEYWMMGLNPLTDPKLFVIPGHSFPPVYPIFFGILSKITPFSPEKLILLFSPFSTPLIFISFFYFLSRLVGEEKAYMSTFVLFSGTTFLEVSTIFIPRSVDWILFPPMLYFFMKDKMKAFTILSVIAVYHHWLYIAPILGALLVFSIVNMGKRKNIPYLFLIFIVSIPLTIISLSYSNNPVGYYVVSQTFGRLIQGLHGWTVFSYFLLFLGVIGIFSKLDTNKDIQKICTYWAVFCIAIFYTNPFRYFTTAAIPLAILGGLAVSKIKRKNVLVGLSLLIGTFFISASIRQLINILLGV